MAINISNNLAEKVKANTDEADQTDVHGFNFFTAF
jgi:hypothetical protein